MRESRLTLGDGDYGYGTVQYGPVADGRVFSITSPFGPRTTFNTPNGVTAGFHQGIDIGYPAGVPLVALERSVVTHVQKDPTSSYGYFIIMSPYGLAVEDGAWYRIQYGHMLHPPLNNPGDVVEEGATVGFIGSTGMSTGPHLHLELCNRNGLTDPYNFLLSSTSASSFVHEPFRSSAILTSEELVAYLQNGGAWVNATPEVDIEGARVVKIILPK